MVEPTQKGPAKRHSGAGHLLIVACSKTKKEKRVPAPALILYDGVNFRVLRKFLREQGWPAGLDIRVLSAEYGLIEATKLIEPYDQRMTADAARGMRANVLDQLSQRREPGSVFINLGKDYRPAVKGIEDVFRGSEVGYAPGPIGMKMHAMKEWLNALPSDTATVRPDVHSGPCYLYFFPDWDDYVYEPFTTDNEKYLKGDRTYAYELCGKKTPFDGVLLSLSHLHIGKGALHRLGDAEGGTVNLRQKLRIPGRLLLFGDCGAFSYASEPNPPFTPEEAAELYDRFGFDIGASVDHIPLRQVTLRRPDGKEKWELSRSTRYRRMYVTRDNAARFLEVWKNEGYDYVPLGVIQGIGVDSYVARLHEYLEMGYEHVALGGLVPRTDHEILEIVCAVRRALQEWTQGCSRNVWLHLLGVLRPKLQPLFRDLGVSSFDSASYFRKAWMRSDQNYLAPDGSRWYGTIRVPISTSRRMREAAAEKPLSEDELEQMEQACLDAIAVCDEKPSAAAEVKEAVNSYGPLLNRLSEDNHFAEKHATLLADRPWEDCKCPFCKEAGIHVVVFRRASRNKRRGFHNTWVFYHKILNGTAVPSASPETA
ncbi:MAG: tRNA-guanine transglycosylase DpdA [Planctomycetota bacterium]